MYHHIVVAICSSADTNTSSEAQTVTELTTSAAPLISFTETTKNDVTSSTEKPTDNTPQHQTTTHQITSAVTSEKTSPSPPASTSPQTPNRTEETYQSHPPETTASNKTSNETVPHVSTTPPSTNATATTTVNTTSPGQTAVRAEDLDHGTIFKSAEYTYLKYNKIKNVGPRKGVGHLFLVIDLTKWPI